jgi:hypothetical protein
MIAERICQLPDGEELVVFDGPQPRRLNEPDPRDRMLDHRNRALVEGRSSSAEGRRLPRPGPRAAD